MDTYASPARVGPIAATPQDVSPVGGANTSLALVSNELQVSAPAQEVVHVSHQDPGVVAPLSGLAAPVTWVATNQTDKEVAISISPVAN